MGHATAYVKRLLDQIDALEHERDRLRSRVAVCPACGHETHFRYPAPPTDKEQKILVRVVQAERERDEARALLRACRPHIISWRDELEGAERPTTKLDDLLARLDALLGGRDE